MNTGMNWWNTIGSEFDTRRTTVSTTDLHSTFLVPRAIPVRLSPTMQQNVNDLKQILVAFRQRDDNGWRGVLSPVRFWSFFFLFWKPICVDQIAAKWTSNSSWERIETLSIPGAVPKRAESTFDVHLCAANLEWTAPRFGMPVGPLANLSTQAMGKETSELLKESRYGTTIRSWTREETVPKPVSRNLLAWTRGAAYFLLNWI